MCVCVCVCVAPLSARRHVCAVRVCAPAWMYARACTNKPDCACTWTHVNASARTRANAYGRALNIVQIRIHTNVHRNIATHLMSPLFFVVRTSRHARAKTTIDQHLCWTSYMQNICPHTYGRIPTPTHQYMYSHVMYVVVQSHTFTCTCAHACAYVLQHDLTMLKWIAPSVPKR
jgi:hypothetical protein